jgi:hypothetical protein
MKGHQFPDGIDPYVKPGHPGSGVLWGINPRPVLTHGCEYTDNGSWKEVDVRKLQKHLKEDPLADGSIFEVMVDN